MPKRKSIGTENVVGQNIVLLRKKKKLKQSQLLSQLQVRGIDLGQSALSDIEGQHRKVSDKELLALSEIFSVPIQALFSPPEE